MRKSFQLLWFLGISLLAACTNSAQSAAADAALAQSLLEQRRIAEARLAINRAIAEHDSDPNYHLLLAQIELTAGSRENAFLAFSDAMSLDGTNLMAMSGVAQLGLELGRLDEAKVAADRMLTLVPSNTQALLVRGLIDYLRNRYRPALAFAEQIVEIDPADEGGAILAVRAYFRLGEVAEAKARLKQFEELAGVTQGSARTRLEIARFEDDVAAMEKSFADLDELMPGDLLVAIDKANFLYKLGRRDPAIAQVEVALTHRDATPTNVADALDVVGEYDGAAQLANRLPSFRARLKPAAQTTLARFLIDRGFPAEATQALEGNRSNDAIALRASVAFRAGRVAEAGRIAGAVLKADENNCDALILSAQIALRGGKAQDAIRLGQRAAAQCPNLVDAWSVTAAGYAAKEDDINARRVFRDGMAALPQNTPMATRFADWLMARNAGREAIAAARRLTNKAPARVSGWELYERLCRQNGDRCQREAAYGLNRARTAYGVDLKPGARQPNTLFGRFERE